MKKLLILIPSLFLFIPLIAHESYISPLPLEWDKASSPIYIEEKPNDVIWLIKRYSDKHWFDSKLALKIAKCESWYRNVKNKNSSAWWIYQQLWRYWDARAAKYWWKWYSRFDIEANISVSIQMMKKEWTRHWYPSKHCWNK